MRPKGLYYVDFSETGESIETIFYATQNYVDNKITGAINTSY